MRRLPGTAALALLAASLSVCTPAQETIPLAFKFSAGEVTSYDVALAGSGAFLAPDGKRAAVGIQGALTFVQTVREVLADGSGRVETLLPKADITVTFDTERVRFSYADGKLRWFANGKESSPPQVDFAKVPLLGSPVVCTIAPDGRVTDLGPADPQALGELARSLPQLSFSGTPGLDEPVFPPAPVRIGETWRTAAQLTPFGAALPLAVTASRTLQSFEEAGGIGLAKIVGFAEARYRGGGARVVSAEGVSVTISDIRQTLTSTEFFNATAGRLVRGDYALALNTTLSAQAGGEDKGEAGVEARLRVTLQAR